MNRALHSSPPRENAVAIALVVSGLAIYGARAAYRSAKAWRPDQQMASGATDPNRLVDDDNPLPGQDTSRFYAGGFEDKMSRREAALILGVRENASKEKIIQQYRQLMRVNHPDLGGSPYISSKVNEAKDLLHKSARSEADGGGK